MVTGMRESMVYYHTPEDTPDKLAYRKMQATAGWLERYVRATCARDESIRFRQRHDDAATLRSAVSLCESLAEISNVIAVASGPYLVEARPATGRSTSRCLVKLLRRVHTFGGPGW